MAPVIHRYNVVRKQYSDFQWLSPNKRLFVIKFNFDEFELFEYSCTSQ